MMELETLSELIGSIYQAAVDSTRWEPMLHAIARAIKVDVGGLFINGREGSPDIVVAIGADPTVLASYEHHYRKIDPVVPRVFEASNTRVVTQRMVIERSEMMRTEFYSDWLRPQHIDDCLAARITDTGTPGIIAFAAPARIGDFDTDTVRLVGLLLPHLRTAVRGHLRLRGLTLLRDGALAALDKLARAVLFVGTSGRVMLANQAAEYLLARSDGLSGDGSGGLQAATPEQTIRLRRLIAEAGGLVSNPPWGGSMVLDRPSGELPLVVTVVPLAPEHPTLLPASEAGAIVIVAMPGDNGSISEPLLQSVFGLTPAEAGVTQAVLRGGGIKAAATALNIAPSTVKTHLLRVFAKTGTSRQAELARRLSHLAAPFP